MGKFPHSELEEYKTQASILYKQLHSSDNQIASQAAQRFQQLSALCDASIGDIQQATQIKLKHALHVIAYEHHFGSWAEFKHHLEKRKQLRAQRYKDFYTLLYPQRCAGYILEWHADYLIAQQALGRDGGYLLPYKNQFFICQANYIEELGLDPDDPDWEAIGYNWVQPANYAAWQRLETKLNAIAKDKSAV